MKSRSMVNFVKKVTSKVLLSVYSVEELSDVLGISEQSIRTIEKQEAIMLNHKLYGNADMLTTIDEMDVNNKEIVDSWMNSPERTYLRLKGELKTKK